MQKTTVAVVRYEKPLESVRKAVELSGGLKGLPGNAKVFIKPNIVFWTRATDFPKWGCITTSRVVEDVVVLLKERGIDDITVGEGIVLFDTKDKETPKTVAEEGSEEITPTEESSDEGKISTEASTEPTEDKVSTGESESTTEEESSQSLTEDFSNVEFEDLEDKKES